MEKIIDVLNKVKTTVFNVIHKFNGLSMQVKAILFVAVLFGTTFTLCNMYNNRDKSMVKICESSTRHNKGIGLTFYVGKDGRTIEVIEKNDLVSLNFIQKNLTDDKDSSKKILDEYKKNSEFIYEETLKKYKDISWFSANLEKKDNYIKATYTFDVGSKDFDYKKHKDILEEFSLQYYYNKEEKKFVYDESVLLSKKTPLGTIKNVACYDAKNNKK